MLLLSDGRVAAVPLIDNGEVLVDLRELPLLQVDPRRQEATGAYARVRRGVVSRLLQARTQLPPGMDFLVVEGHRPAAVQRQYFENYQARLARSHPDWPAQQLYVEVSKFVSPVSVAPHPCGAAIDLTLCDGDGVELDMGTAVNASPEESHNQCFTDAVDLEPRARRNRNILCSVLSAVGLINYPTEWWHWSFGDRYWAAVTGAAAAVYGPID